MGETTREFLCPKKECSYSSESRVGIAIHHSKSHGESLQTSHDEVFECPAESCEQSFRSEHGLNIHYTKVHENASEDLVTCPACNRTFDTEPGMKAHHTVKHGKSLNEDEGGLECPHSSCSQTFNSEMGVKVHHVKAHEESIAQVKVECANCGEVTSKIQSEAKRAGTHFCSNHCKFEHKTGESSPYYKRVEVNCSNCGDSILKQPSQVERSDLHFCDKSCMGEYRDTKIEVSCEYCNSTLRRRRYKVEENEKNFCSPECHVSYLHENAEYPDPRDDPRLDEWREEVFNRDNHTCQDCGEMGGYLAAHHIERWSEAPDKRFELSNGVTLCRDCHYERHKKAGDSYADLIRSSPEEESENVSLHDFL